MTVEPHYTELITLDQEQGRQQFGLMSSEVWHRDPARLPMLLSRYKFVARMLTGCATALEVGCADGFGSRLVRQTVPTLVASDLDPLFIADARANTDNTWPITFVTHDMLTQPFDGTFDAAYALDVLEHIHPNQQHTFLHNMSRSITAAGVCIIGMPSLESQQHASPLSKAAHVNCQTGEQLRATLSAHFRNVFLFSMNDEMVHTGFTPMAHYLIGVCASPRSPGSSIRVP